MEYAARVDDAGANKAEHAVIVEYSEIPAGVMLPRKPTCYVTLGPQAKDGTYSMFVKVSVCNAQGRWYGCTVLTARGFTDDDRPMELRKNLRTLAELRVRGQHGK